MAHPRQRPYVAYRADDALFPGRIGAQYAMIARQDNAVSDTFSNFATIKISALMQIMQG